MPTHKYRGLGADPIDGRPLFWNVHPDGFPVRQGDSPELVNQAQLDAAGVNVYFRSALLKIPEEMDKYCQIWDWISNGVAVLKSEDKREDPSDPTKWTVWLCWVDIRGYIPARPQVGSAARGVGA